VDESGVLPVDIIPLWLSTLIYHLAHWWLQFRDVVLPHQHEQQKALWMFPLQKRILCGNVGGRSQEIIAEYTKIPYNSIL
jgi:hypothetical protein